MSESTRHLFSDCPIPVIGFAGYSGSGKTTLLRQVISILRSRGVRAAVIKHAHHGFDTDQPGKDSFELRKAGAGQMLVSSSKRWALVNELHDQAELTLPALVDQLDLSLANVVLVEGFKQLDFPKIAIRRYQADHEVAPGRMQKPTTSLYSELATVIAVATDDLERARDETIGGGVPILDLDDPTEVAEFIEQQLAPGNT